MVFKRQSLGSQSYVNLLKPQPWLWRYRDWAQTLTTQSSWYHESAGSHHDATAPSKWALILDHQKQYTIYVQSKTEIKVWNNYLAGIDLQLATPTNWHHKRNCKMNHSLSRTVHFSWSSFILLKLKKKKYEIERCLEECIFKKRANSRKIL